MRQPQIRYFESRQAYYTQIGRKQYRLGVTMEEAKDAFHRLMAGTVTDREGPKARCVDVFQAHLDAMKDSIAPPTSRTRSLFLGYFLADHGAIRLGQLTRGTLDRWFAGKPTWGVATRKTALAALNAAINWAVGRGTIAANPVTGYRLPPLPPTGKVLISPEQHALLLAWFSRRKAKGFADYLDALGAPGARRGELQRVTAADFEPAERRWVLWVHKTARSTGRPRVIYVSDRLLPTIKRLNECHREGPIFLGDRGTPISERAVLLRFVYARKRLNEKAVAAGQLPPFDGQTAYSYRHRFATDWLRAGKPLGYLCQLLGTSPAMIHKHYGHLGEHAADLRAALDGFSPPST